jgi:parallel beta-helix repeat protein
MRDVHPTLHNFHVDVKMFGATGNGVADDTTAIQAAGDAILSAGGGTLHFPKGTYPITAFPTWTGMANVRFVGTAGAVIKAPGGAQNTVLRFVNATDLEIVGMTFEANGSTSYGGVNIKNSQRVWVHECRFIESNPQVVSVDTFGLSVNTVNFGEMNTDIYVSGCYFDYMTLEIDSASRVHVWDNIVKRTRKTCGIGSFSEYDSTTVTHQDWDIHDNIIIDPDCSNGAITFAIDPATDDNNVWENVRIHDNVIRFTTNVANEAIWVGTNNNTVATTGVAFRRFAIESNTIIYETGTPARAIFTNNSDTSAIEMSEWSVQNNLIRLPGTASEFGIELRNLTNSLIAGNIVLNGKYGIHVQDMTNVIFADNVASVSGAGSIAYRAQQSDGGFKAINNVILGSPVTRWSVSNAHATDSWIGVTDTSNLLFGSAEDTNLYRAAANQLKSDDNLQAVDGVATKVKAGTPVDGDFATTPPVGTIVVDTTGNKIWVRTAAATWKGVVVA